MAATSTCSVSGSSSSMMVSRQLAAGGANGLLRTSTTLAMPMPMPMKRQQQSGRGRVRCEAASAPLIISLSTGALLFLGRFVFLPFQREQVKKAGLPVQNGITHFEAGDVRAAEASGFLKTGDPAGFTLVDVLAWGALGHAVAFFILATASNGYEPTF